MRILISLYPATHCALQTQTASTRFSLHTNTFNSCPVFRPKSSMHPLWYTLAFLICLGCCIRGEFRCKITIASQCRFLQNRMMATALHSLLQNIDVPELAIPMKSVGFVGSALVPCVLLSSPKCHFMVCAISCGAPEKEDNSKVDCLVFECFWVQAEACTAN